MCGGRGGGLQIPRLVSPHRACLQGTPTPPFRSKLGSGPRNGGQRSSSGAVEVLDLKRDGSGAYSCVSVCVCVCVRRCLPPSIQTARQTRRHARIPGQSPAASPAPAPAGFELCGPAQPILLHSHPPDARCSRQIACAAAIHLIHRLRCSFFGLPTCSSLALLAGPARVVPASHWTERGAIPGTVAKRNGDDLGGLGTGSGPGDWDGHGGASRRL